jgi:hypothetical protein
MQVNTARGITLFAMFGTMGAIILLISSASGLGVDLEDPVAWLQHAPTEDAIAAVAWLTALILSVWLMVTSFVYAAAALVDATRTKRVLSLLTLPPVRRAIDTIAAVSIAIATFGPYSPAVAAAAHNTGPITTSMRPEGRQTYITPPGWHGVGFMPAARPQAPPSSDVPHHPRQPTNRNNDTARAYSVVAGDNLWRISCREVREAVDDPTLGQVTSYWLEVIEANRDIIRSGDPDLIYPGEELVLPAVTHDDGGA